MLLFGNVVDLESWGYRKLKRRTQQTFVPRTNYLYIAIEQGQITLKNTLESHLVRTNNAFIGCQILF